MKTRWVGLVIGIASLAVTRMGAAEPSKEDRARADALFDEGRAAMKRNDLTTACAKFAESESLDPAPGTLRNQAECEARAGRFAAAEALLTSALEMPAADDLRAACRADLASLREHASKLKVTLDGAALPDDATLSIDGKEIAKAMREQAVIVDAGKHHVALTTSSGTRARDVSVAAGETSDLDFDASAAAPPKTEATHETSASATSSGSPWPWIVGGVGVVGLGVATFTGLKLASTKNEISGCKPACTSSQASDGSSAKGLIPVYYAGWAVGVIGVGVGVTWLLTEGGGDKASASVRVGPGSVAVEGRF